MPLSSLPFFAAEACELAAVADVPSGVVFRGRCPARDDVFYAYQFVFVAVGAEDAESGSEAPFDGFKSDELFVGLVGRLSFPFSTCNPPYVQRVAVSHSSRHGLLQSLNGFLVLDDLDLLCLCGATGHELEGGFLTDVLEVLARLPADIDLLDVAGAEILGGSCAFGLEAGLEIAECAELYALAGKHHLSQTIYGDGEQTDDVALAIHAAVILDVLGKFVDVDDLAALGDAVGLRFGNLRLLGSGLGAHDGNTVVNHSNYRPSP